MKVLLARKIMVVTVSRSMVVRGSALAALALLAACSTRPGAPKPASPSQKPASAAQAPACQAQPSSPLVGNWFSSSTPKGVGGQLQTLTRLRADGTMGFESQLKIGKKMRPALRESGCWTFADGIYTLQTLKSYGDDVDSSDPIYKNTYRVEKVDAQRLVLREMRQGGQVITARKMPDGYRMPDR